jgi:hypothetical protein
LSADRVASRVPSESREYLSADRVASGSEQIPNVDVLYTENILNAITQPNYPKQRLVLKVVMPVILMRNLNPGMGLCNGTRLLITRLVDCVLEVTDMTSSSSGLNKHWRARAIRKNTERGDCKEQQLCMEFIDSKESFASKDIRKKPKEHARGAALHATRTTNIYLPHRTTRTEIHAYTRNAMLRQIKKN